MQFIGIDVGRDSVKVASENKNFKFKSKVSEWRPRRLVNDDKYEVELDGQKYFIADLADEGFYEREMMLESKIHFETKLLFLSALALTVNNSNEKYCIVTGLPVKQHVDNTKKELNDLLKGSYSVVINNQAVNLNLGEVWVVPEGAASAWDLVLNEQGKLLPSPLLVGKVRVIDIGSRTINYCTLEKLKYIDRESGTFDYGCVVLQNADINSYEEFVRKLIGDLSKVWLTLKPTDTVVITGGGSVLLREYLKPHFPVVYFGDEFSNARGYYKMGRLRWNKENGK
jgi:plasmid segregation protein ParM